MKVYYKLLTIAGVLTFMLSGALIYIPITGSGCGIPSCCPRIDENSLVYPAIICHPDCQGGGIAKISGRIEFKRMEELCEPPSGFKIYIYNVTDHTEIPPVTFNQSSTGIIEFMDELSLTHDTKFELRADGDCGTATKEFKITVLNKDQADNYHLIFTDKKSWPLENLVWKRDVEFGEGLILEGISNENGFKIDIDVDNLILQLPKKGIAGASYSINPLYRIRANNGYTVKIPDETEYKTYSDLGKPDINLTLRVRCDCP